MEILQILMVFTLIMTLECAPLNGFKRKRLKRGKDDVEPVPDPAYELQFQYYPLPAHRPETLDPVFPMTHSFSNGFQFQNNADYAALGHLNVPILKNNWGIWDMKADIYPQSSNPLLNFGYATSPVNPLNMSPQEIDDLMTSPEARKIRRGSNATGVNSIPPTETWLAYGARPFEPLACRPPMCNPYTHSFVTGYQYQQGFDIQLPGKLDFPIPGKNPTDVSKRWTMTSNFVAGIQPQAFNYGHHLNAVDPWKGGFMPAKDTYPGNPFALKSVLHPEPKNTVPYVSPRLNPNIFEQD